MCIEYALLYASTILSSGTRDVEIDADRVFYFGLTQFETVWRILLRCYRYHGEGFVCRPVTFTDETPFGPQLTFQSVFTLIRVPDELAAPANFRISCGRRKFFAILKLSLTIERAISMVDKSREHTGVRPSANYSGWIENIKCPRMGNGNGAA